MSRLAAPHPRRRAARREPGAGVARVARTRRRRGFTLIELLVAVTLLAVVAALGWRGLSAVADSRDSAQTAFAATSRLADGLQQMDDDLRQATDAGTGLPAVQVLGDALWIVRRPPQPLGGSLQAGAGLPPDAGALQLVRWQVRDGALTRAASAPTTRRADLLAVLRDPNLPALTILPGVSGMDIAFFRYAGIGLLQQSGAWVNPGTAANAYAAAAGENPALQLAASATTPAAVKVQLWLDGAQLRGRIERDFLLDDRQ